MSKIITEWNSKQFLAEVSGKLVQNMDRACHFAADQARAKAPRRTGILAKDIDYEVTAEANEVVGAVGVKKGKAFYGYFLEVGTRKMAARPFLRPAVLGNIRAIVRMLAGEG